MESEVCFSNPYHIFLSEDFCEGKDLKYGKPVKITFENGKEIIGKLKNTKNLEIKKEIISWMYLVPKLLYNYETPENLEEFEGFIVEEGAEIDDFENLVRFLNLIKTKISSRWKNKDIIVGSGFFERILRDKREVQELLKYPFSSFDSETIFKSLIRDFPEVKEVESYQKEVLELETVTFCSGSYRVEKDQTRKNIIERFEQIEYLKKRDHILRDGPTLIHGPIYSEERGENEGEVFKITKETEFDFSSAYFGTINFKERVSFSEFKRVMEENFGDKFEIKKPAPEEIVLEFHKVMFFFHNRNEEESIVSYKISHFPRDLEDLELDREKGILNFIENNFKVEISKPSVRYPPIPRKEEWVLDTNSLYLQDLDNNPNNIMMFVYPNFVLYGSELKIPSGVLYEVNAKKEEDSSKAKNLAQQALKNLDTLKLLSNYGFFELDVVETLESRDNPKVDTGIIMDTPSSSGVITSDKLLRELARFMDRPVIDPREFSFSKSKGFDIWESIKEILESRIKITKPSLKENLERKFKKKMKPEKFEELKETGGEEEEFNPGKVIDNYIKEGRILETINSGTKYIWLCKEEEALIDYNFLLNIEKFIDEGYLTKDFLEEIRKNKGGLGKEQLPKLILKIPQELVWKAISGREEKKVHMIKTLKNAECEFVSLEGPDTNKKMISKAQEDDLHLITGSRKLRELAEVFSITFTDINDLLE